MYIYFTAINVRVLINIYAHAHTHTREFSTRQPAYTAESKPELELAHIHLHIICVFVFARRSRWSWSVTEEFKNRSRTALTHTHVCESLTATPRACASKHIICSSKSYIHTHTNTRKHACRFNYSHLRRAASADQHGRMARVRACVNELAALVLLCSTEIITLWRTHRTRHVNILL